MKVILTSDIDDIGLAGEVKTVKKGLARNYLIPQKLAIEATDSNLRDWDKKLEALKQKREKTIAEAQEAAQKIEGTVVSMESKVSSGEKMFGSVNAQAISEALKEQHDIDVDRKNILLERNIKSIGTHDVSIRIKAHIKASIVVEISSDEEDEVTEEAADAGQEEAPEAAADSENAGQTEQPQAAEQTETQAAESPASPEQTASDDTRTAAEEENKTAQEN